MTSKLGMFSLLSNQLCTDHIGSKSQYEYQFKKWGLRKYTKRKRPHCTIEHNFYNARQEKRRQNTKRTMNIPEANLIREHAVQGQLSLNIEVLAESNRGNALMCIIFFTSH
jgi:hypothetical protein